jgi:ABC-type siderophore export system fused ATPase/permease subunit
MKSVGEVMSIGRNFEEALQKSIRMLDNGADGLVLNRKKDDSFNEEQIEEHLQTHDDHILFHVVNALRAGISTEKIYQLSSIDFI